MSKSWAASLMRVSISEGFAGVGQTAQAQVQVATSGEQRAWDELSWKKTNEMADNMLNEEKHEWDVDRETQELQIERQQKRPVSATCGKTWGNDDQFRWFQRSTRNPRNDNSQ